MATNSQYCAILDDSFGPHAGECRGGFDFTLLFEETIFTILPIALVMLIAPIRIFCLLRRDPATSYSHIVTVKLSAWITLAALQLAALVLWANPSAARTRVSLAAAVLTPISTLVLCLVSYSEHLRTVRPSSLLNIFLLFSLLLDIAHARTLWLRAFGPVNHAIAYVSAAAILVKTPLVGLEALGKTRWLLVRFQASPPESTSNIYNRSLFWWLNPLFRSGYRKVLDIDDLFTLDKFLSASYWQPRFLSAYKLAASRPTNQYSLNLLTLRLLWRPLVETILPRLSLTALMFCQPFLINLTIRLSQEPDSRATRQEGYGLIGAYFFVYVGIAITMGMYQHRTYRTITMARAGLVSIIYNKISRLNIKDLDPATSMTLMSADMERIVQGWQTIHENWANAIEVALAIYLLEQQLGIACVVPVAVSIASLLGSMVAMNFIMSRQAMWLEAIEKRISATSTMLASIKGIKMSGLRDTLLSTTQELRVEELRISKRFRKLIIWNMVFAYLTQVFAPVLTFAVFSVRARDSGDQTLDTARVFTALSLFALLSEPLASLVMSLATFLGAVGSFARIQEFLASDERIDERVHDHSTERKSDDAIVVREADLGWDPTKPPQLRSVSISIPRRKLTVVVGPVGCGKTTLLHALLGEIRPMAGSVLVDSTGAAYCAQNPWHINGTIRDTITGNSEYDEKWYAQVVGACALGQDFRQLPQGDLSPIGSGGVALSGGQSQRIALARAVYSHMELCVLDDSFSGLDRTTENHVFESLLGKDGLLRKLHTTVVLVSSSAKHLSNADYIIAISPDGRVEGKTSLQELKKDSSYALSISSEKTDDAAELAISESEKVDFLSSSDQRNSELVVCSKETESSTSATSSDIARNDDTHDMTSRQTGDVQIYLYYIRSVGILATLIFVVAIVGFIFCISFPTVWVQWWAAANDSAPNSRLGYWLGVYAALGAAAIVCLAISCWQMIITMVPRSGESFHLSLLGTVLNAPMSFFVNTDSGEILNRFSQDLQLIDMELPIAALNTFTTFVLCIAQMVLIGVGSVYAAVSFPIVLAVLYLIQKVYLRTSRQLRLMDLEAKAPLYTLFEESLRGLVTIRAFGWEQQLEDKNHTLLDRSQRPFYLLFAVQRWLTLVLDLVVAAVAVLLIVLVVSLRGTVTAGGIGLALIGVIQFSQHVKLLVTFWTTLETHIGSVARIKSFTETTAGEDGPGEDQLPPPDWPSAGAIDINSLCVTYGENKVLRDITLSIRAGDKVAICGRTGSGKTSLIMSLFRIADWESGSIAVDGIDLSTIPREEVRRRIVGVSQQPFLLKGSVRLNADPTGFVGDDAIKEALGCVQLMDVVNNGGGLDADIESLNLSSGQKQLFCLARAMLRHSTILVLDEATSSIDPQTEDVVQRVIRKKFAQHTIIAIAHRLDTIMDFDKVAVLDSGKIVELGSPYALLDTPGSAFARLYHSDQQNREECAW